MIHDMNFNSDRLKKARIYRGFTVAELADKIGCQRQTISMYENKKILSPDSSVIQKLSAVLEFPIKYFYENDKDINLGTTYFRSLLTTNKRYRNEQIQKIEFISRIYDFLNDYVDFPELNLPQIDENVTPEEAANVLRTHWGLGDKPIQNIIYETEQNGIIVTSFDTDTDDIDAFSQYISNSDDGNDLYIIGYSNNKTSAARIHFDIAHELGHICLHDWSEDLESLTKDEFKEREQEAHNFASAFLLPATSFKKDVMRNPKSIPYYTQLKRKWKVSISAMIRRSFNLGIISYDEYQMLYRVLQRRGMRKTEPLDDSLITASPSLLKTSVQLLLEEKVFTPQELIDELAFSYSLSLYPLEIEHLLDLPKGTLNISKVIPIHELRLKNTNSD